MSSILLIPIASGIELYTLLVTRYMFPLSGTIGSSGTEKDEGGNGMFLLSTKHLAIPKGCFLVSRVYGRKEGMVLLLASSRQEQGMLLNVLPYTE